MFPVVVHFDLTVGRSAVWLIVKRNRTDAVRIINASGNMNGVAGAGDHWRMAHVTENWPKIWPVNRVSLSRSAGEFWNRNAVSFWKLVAQTACHQKIASPLPLRPEGDSVSFAALQRGLE